jgi:hypothetical protein
MASHMHNNDQNQDLESLGIILLSSGGMMSHGGALSDFLTDQHVEEDQDNKLDKAQENGSKC